MPTEYNKSHIQGILKKNGKNTTLHNFVLFLWSSIYLTLSCFGFHQVSKRSKTINLGLRPRGFECFLAFGNLMKPSHSFLKQYLKKQVVATSTIQEHRLQEIFMLTVPIQNYINCLSLALGLICGMRYPVTSDIFPRICSKKHSAKHFLIF